MYHSGRHSAEKLLEKISDKVEATAKKAEEFKSLVNETLEMLNVFPEKVKQETIANIKKIFGYILPSFD